ncbi:MAG: carboxypeptidase regulatory-like domain-containing protein [Bacteroidia bacterium]
MKYLIIFFLSFWGLFSKSPEPKIIFTGTVKDSTNNAVIELCQVKIKYLKSGFTFETMTDYNGRYSLNIVPGTFTVDYSFLGYSSFKKSYKVYTKSDTIIEAEVLLKNKSASLEEITVLTFKKELVEADASKSTVSGKEILKMPKRGLKGVASTSAGVSTSSGKGTSFLGSRTDGTRVFIEGTHVLSSDGGSSEGISGDRVTYNSRGINSDIKAGTLTAGEINDFSKWSLWEDLSKGELGSFVNYWGIAPKHRFSVQVTNENKFPLTDIIVVLKDPSGKAIWQSHTDNTGKAELWANLYDSSDLKKGKYSIEGTYNGKTFTIKDAASFSISLNKLVIPSVCSQPLNMDIVFAVDATGSMGDEISYLQAELYDVIEKVKQGNPGLNLNMGSVFYRDKEDLYLTVQQNLTSDINTVMDFMKAQSADGGGDEPEGVDAAMEVAIGKFKWRSEARARVMFLVLDASPHHDEETMDKLKKYTKMAAEKGIRIVPIVCSGIDKASEYLMRSIALATNGNYIFLTDHSGIGDGHITPSTDKFDVETLNVLLIRLLQQYIFMPECNRTVNTNRIDSLQHNQPDSTSADSSFVQNPNSNKDSTSTVNNKPDDWFLKYYPNPCRGILKVEVNANISELYIADINGKLLMKIPLASDEHYKEIDMTAYPAGVYFLRYCVDGKCKSGKFVLVH